MTGFIHSSSKSGQLLVIAALLVSCDSGETSMGPPSNQAPSIAVGVNPQSTSILQGGTAQVTATVTKTNFAGAVTLSVSGNPSSIAANITQPPATGGVTGGVINLVVGSSTNPGTYNLTIQASAAGVSPAQVPFVVTVMSIGSFALATMASGVAVPAGASGNVAVSLIRDNFTSLIALDVSGLPQGVTGTFAPAASSGTSSTLTLAVAGNVPLGNHQLTIRGTSAGMAPSTVPITLTVGPLTTFTIAISNTPVSVVQGAATSLTLSLARGASFSSAVGLSVEGAPQGLTAAINPASVTGTSTTLTLSAAASVGIRTYLLTIRASAPGVPEQRLTLPVRITGI